MADANGLNPGDFGYNAATDPLASGSGGSGFGFQPITKEPVPTPTGGKTPSGTPVYALGPTGTAAGQTIASPAKTFDNANDAFNWFVNSNPSYAGGGQAAIDAFAQAYPQYSGIIAWDPSRTVYEGQGGAYFTNLPGNPQGGWSITQGDSGGSGSSGGFSIDPSYLAPFTQPFVAPGDPSNPASAAAVLNPQAFTLPTEADLKASPGYQGGQDAATQAVVNSNASKGLVNSGGNIFDLANVTAGLEGQQYNDLVNQKANAAGINSGFGQQAFNDAWQQYLNQQSQFYANQTNPYNKILGVANLGLTAAGNAG
jgi:hypothetical protein